MNVLAWLEQTEFSTWLRESDWGYPIVLCFHAVGMGMVVGVSHHVLRPHIGIFAGIPA